MGTEVFRLMIHKYLTQKIMIVLILICGVILLIDYYVHEKKVEIERVRKESPNRDLISFLKRQEENEKLHRLTERIKNR